MGSNFREINRNTVVYIYSNNYVIINTLLLLLLFLFPQPKVVMYGDVLHTHALTAISYNLTSHFHQQQRHNLLHKWTLVSNIYW